MRWPASIGPLLGPETAVVFVQNGIPWWYGHGLDASRPPAPDLSRLDPGGALAKAVGYERTLGGAISSPNHVVEPGVIVNEEPDRNIALGRRDRRSTDAEHRGAAQGVERRGHRLARDDAISVTRSGTS